MEQNEFLNILKGKFSFKFSELFIMVFENNNFGGRSNAIFFSQGLFIGVSEEGFINDFGDSIISLESFVSLRVISNI